MNTLQSVVSSTISHLGSYLPSSLTTDHIGNQELLKLGDAVAQVLEEIKQIGNSPAFSLEIPRLVVVGSQSSGKSSLLNRILAMDILPTGKTMVTRTPLNLQLTQLPMSQKEQTRAVFGHYTDGQWTIEKTISLTFPLPSKEEIHHIRCQIEEQTVQRAGPQKAVSLEEITLCIHSPKVPNLSLIDLPGLTMVACTDQGQPSDIKQQIRKMVRHYIAQKHSIILAVMPAREDLEADMALDLIKESDPRGERTMGILTKVDLMNQDASIQSYLTNAISSDLQLAYGYYGVRNRSSKEARHIDVMEATNHEKKYFQSHGVYKHMLGTENRLGIEAVTRQLSKILMSRLREYLPNLFSQIISLQDHVKDVLGNLGTSVPSDKESRMALIHGLLTDLARDFVASLEIRGSRINAGRKLKDTLVTYRRELQDIQPFRESKFSIQKIEDAIRNCEGNHMSSPCPPIEILEQILKTTQPFNLIREPSVNLIRNIGRDLIQLIQQLSQANKQLARFDALTAFIMDHFTNSILIEAQQNTIQKVEEFLQMEDNYIWTDDVAFHNTLTQMNQVTSHNVRSILSTYFQVIRCHIQHHIPKIVMSFLVTAIENSLMIALFREIRIHSHKEVNFLKENKEQDKRRQQYTLYQSKLAKTRHLLETTLR